MSSPSPDSPAPHAGQRVGAYRLTRLLARGSHFHVWRAERADGAFEREVALRIARPGAEARWAAERDLLARLDHPHLVRLYDASMPGETPCWLAVELLDPGDLVGACQRQGLELQARVARLLPALDALVWLHELGGAHGALGSRKILLDHNGRPRLIGPHACDDPGSMRTDMVAIAGILQELIAAPHLPLSASGGDAAGRTATGWHAGSARRRALEAIAARAAQTDPLRAYPGVRALAADLQGWAERRAPAPVERPALPRLARWLHRPRAIAIGAALAAMLGVALLLGAVRSEGNLPGTALAPGASAAALAVLPFRDRDAPEGERYFAEGLAEEVLDALARGRGLRLVARATSFPAGNRAAKPVELAREMQATHLVTGEVQRANGAMNVSVRLLRASDGAELWTGAYEVSNGEAMQIPVRIATAVAQALDTQLQAVAAGTRDVHAYQDELRGNYFFHRGQPGDIQQAVFAYRSSIEHDPSYALAWARLGHLYLWQGSTGELALDQARQLSLQALERAAALDPGLAMAHANLGSLHRDLEWNFELAGREYELARRLDPQGESGWQATEQSAMMDALRSGNFELVLALLTHDHEIKPRDTDSFLILGTTQLLAGQPEASMETLQRLVALEPSAASARAYIAFDLIELGRPAQALAALKGETDEILALQARACAQHLLGSDAHAHEALKEMERRFAGVAAYNIAAAHACLGERDEALRWLDHAAEVHDPGTLEVRHFPMFRNLHQDPQFRAFVQRHDLGL
jgi:TolB-like protein/Tfp pilus assembly protein PilF